MDLAAVREKKSRPGPASESAASSPTRDYVQIRNPNSAEADRPEREVNVKADFANLANVKADDTYVGGWSTPSSELASMSSNDPEALSRVSLAVVPPSSDHGHSLDSLAAVPVLPKPKKTEVVQPTKTEVVQPTKTEVLKKKSLVDQINVSAILRAALDPQSLRDTQERIADLWFADLLSVQSRRV